MIRGVLFLLIFQAVTYAQNNLASTQPATSSCPAEVVQLNPSHESFWDNMATTKCYGSHCDNAHNKFLEVKVKNNIDKTIVGMKFATAYYDATEDLSTVPVQWNMHGKHIKPGEIGTANWNNNLRQHEAVIGWVIVPTKILYEDGSKWQASGKVTDCMYEWWKDKRHPRVNKAPEIDGKDVSAE